MLSASGRMMMFLAGFKVLFVVERSSPHHGIGWPWRPM
jgi:hypothetical protein